jgi:hypothetical protein
MQALKESLKSDPSILDIEGRRKPCRVPRKIDGGWMDKGGYHPLHTAVDSGEPFPGSRAAVSLLSRLVLDMASPLLSVPSTGGMPRMVIPARPTEVLTTNAYCATCLRTRRFFDRPTHLQCETCAKRLDKLAPDRGLRSFDR